MPSESGLNTIPHCLEWYMLVLRTRLPSLAVRVVRIIVLLRCRRGSVDTEQ